MREDAWFILVFYVPEFAVRHRMTFDPLHERLIQPQFLLFLRLRMLLLIAAALIPRGLIWTSGGTHTDLFGVLILIFPRAHSLHCDNGMSLN